MSILDAYHFFITAFAVAMCVGILRVLNLRKDGPLALLREFFWYLMFSSIGVWCIELFWLTGAIDDLWWLQEIRKGYARTLIALGMFRLFTRLL